MRPSKELAVAAESSLVANDADPASASPALAIAIEIVRIKEPAVVLITISVALTPVSVRTFSRMAAAIVLEKEDTSPAATTTNRT